MIAAFDLSLAATGYAAVAGDGGLTVATLAPPKGLTGLARLDWIQNAVIARGTIAETELVVMEDLAYGANLPGAAERTGLAFLIRHELWLQKRRFLLVPPATLKKFVTGAGNAEKGRVIKDVYKRWKVDVNNDNEADAFGLAMIGLAVLDRYDAFLTEDQRQISDRLRKGMG